MISSPHLLTSPINCRWLWQFIVVRQCTRHKITFVLRSVINQLSQMGMRQQRHSDGQTNVPQQQIVGFHVEGQSPSPSPNSILQESLRTISTGSPTPVIIPPQFQVCPG